VLFVTDAPLIGSLSPMHTSFDHLETRGPLPATFIPELKVVLPTSVRLEAGNGFDFATHVSQTRTRPLPKPSLLLSTNEPRALDPRVIRLAVTVPIHTHTHTPSYHPNTIISPDIIGVPVQLAEPKSPEKTTSKLTQESHRALGNPIHTILSSLLLQPPVNTRPPLLPTSLNPNFTSAGYLVMGSDIPITSEILVSRRHSSRGWTGLYPGYQHHSLRFRMRMHVPCVITNSPLDTSLTMKFYEKLTLIIA
jgi:hypothetical protein